MLESHAVKPIEGASFVRVRLAGGGLNDAGAYVTAEAEEDGLRRVHLWQDARLPRTDCVIEVSPDGDHWVQITGVTEP